MAIIYMLELIVKKIKLGSFDSKNKTEKFLTFLDHWKFGKNYQSKADKPK